MAMRDLVEGDCGLTNPLVKVASHFTQDKEQQIGQLPYASAPDKLVKEFLLETQGTSQQRNVPQTFHMASLLHEMSEIDKLCQQPRKAQEVENINETETWLKDYLVTEELNISSSDMQQRLNTEGNIANTLGSFDNKWAEEYLVTSEQDIQNQHHFGDQWVQSFKTENCSEICEIANGLLETVDDPKFSESKFMQFIRNVGEGKINLEENEEILDASTKPVADIWSADFGSAWAASPTEEASALGDAWSKEYEENAEFTTFTRTEDEKQEEEKNDADFWEKLQREWEQMAKDDPSEHPWLTDFESFTEPYKEYTFASENPLIGHAEPFEEGLRKLKSGDLPSAVLLFESAVQKNPEHMEAWQHLGTSQAENEQDPAAIAALKRCLELDPGNLTALMALAVSYTNETLQTQACSTLNRWLESNPKYSHLTSQISDNTPENELYTVSSVLPSEKHKVVKDMFIEAARMAPSDPDPDVQSGLGVLFNLSGEYAKAADCFKAALQIKPQDSLLWNRLGATLANGNRSEDAIVAYHNALELSPGFIRSRFNLGISCINLGAVKEAAEHFLTALNLQNAGRGPQGTRSKAAMSGNIWSTLRMVMTLTRRPDLYDAVERRDLDLLNKEFGMDG